MNNELYRKLTSITLMTIMFAGGMTIAIPGETPVAVAQTSMLSVSATAAPGNSFGGPQIIQIIVDDPARSETGDDISQPHVTADGDDVEMEQADTGKWYAYVASPDLGTIPGGSPTTSGSTVTVADFLDNAPRTTEDAAINDIQIFGFDGDVEIELVGIESVTLNYDQDLDDLATVSTDRTGVPEGAEVHVTISDFRLNLDPTTSDVWFMNADGSLATYVDTFVDPPTDWRVAFIGDDNDAGTFEIDNLERAVIADDADTAATNTTNIVRFEETGANTGVFESQNNDISNIVATGDENDDFTIDYAGNSVQVFIESFDSTLEAISDGTWNSGNSLTVRLSDENLDTNTLTDQDMKIDHEKLPILMIGTPITLATVTINEEPDTDGNQITNMTVNTSTHVGTLVANTTDADVALTLSDDQVSQIKSGASYIHYSGPDVDIASDVFSAIANANLTKDGLTAIDVVDEPGNTISLNYTVTLTDERFTGTAVFDIFTFGDGVNHAIYRALLDETDAGSVFEATIEYEMLNQRTVNDAATHDNVVAVGNELVMILDTGYTGTDAPEIDYAGDNASEDAPTNTGEVALDSETYRVSDDVTITLTDADLNTDSGAKEIYQITHTEMSGIS